MTRLPTCALAVVLLGVVLYACGGGGESPTGAVEAAMKAMIEMDEESLDEYVCKDIVSQAREALGMIKMTKDKGATMELHEMKYELVSEAEDKALVKVTGKIKGSHPEFGDMEEPIEEDMDVIMENGHWKVCNGFL